MEYKLHIWLPAEIDDIFDYCTSKNGFIEHFPQPIKWIGGTDIWNKPQHLHFAMKFVFFWVDYITEVTEIKKNEYFVDIMRKGPYKYFEHKHTFKKIDNGTLYTDTINFSLGYGAFIDQTMGKMILSSIFKKRHHNLKQKFS